MFDALKKKLQSGISRLSRSVAEKEPEIDFEKEEEFLHEKEVSIEQVLKEEPEKIEQEQEAEEHFEEEEPSRQLHPHLKKERLREREEKQERPTLEDKMLDKEEVLEKKGFLGRLKGIPISVTEKTLSQEDIDNFFSEYESDLLYSNIALEVVEFLRESLKRQLADSKIKRGQTSQFIREAFENALLEILDQGSISLDSLPKPATLVFLGFNGSGKTTSISKIAKYLISKKKLSVLAAGDTFRAASIEQLEAHAQNLGLKVIKHQYGADSAAVIFDAKKHAQARGLDFVLADTAGRAHTDKNLMDELKKVVRVNKPELKILVVDSLTGNDAVEQARLFHQEIGVDAVVLTKLDVNTKGGSILSVAYAIKKPILFLGTGQEYENLVKFDPKKFVQELLS